MMTRRFAIVLAGLSLAGTLLQAQQPPAPAATPQPPAPPQPAMALQPPQRPARGSGPVYRVELTVSELEGSSRVNSRTYMLLSRSEEPGMLRVGSRVPTSTASGTQYMDIGLKWDLQIQETDGRLTGMLSLELNMVAPGEIESAGSQTVAPAPPRGANPVLRDLRVRVPFALTPGKPSVVAMVDDVNSTRKFQLELVAARI